MPPSGKPPTLDVLRGQALLNARHATDPLVKQQFIDLAASYADAAAELRGNGIAIMPPAAADRLPWRSVPLWCSNDR